MSRRGYASSDFYEERERDAYEPRRSAGPRTVYQEDIEIHERRRGPERDRDLDFLRDDDGRHDSGQLVLREQKREQSRERPRRRDREVDETVISRGAREKPRETRSVAEEVVIARGGRERPRRDEFVERDEYERDVVYRPREWDLPQQVRSEKEEFIFRRGEREREREPLPLQPIRSEREEYVFRAPTIREPSPEPERERTEISIRERSRGPAKGRDYRDEEEIIIRKDERSREPPRDTGRERDFEEDLYIDRNRRRPRASSYERESITIDSRERETPRAKSRGDFRGEEEQIIIRRGEREPRPRTPPVEEEQIVIRRGDRQPRPRTPPMDDEQIIIRRGERQPRPRTPPRADEEIIIRRGEREPRQRSPSRGEEQIVIRRDEGRSRARSRGRYEEEDIMIRHGGDHDRYRERSRETFRGDYEDITFKHDDHNGRHKDEIIIRRDERSPSPERIPEPPRAPEPTRAPPIVQEIITHHRHIDHGFERAPEPPVPRARTPPPAPRVRSPPPPPRPRSPSPVREERIEIRHSGSRNGRQYDEDFVFERETGGRRQLDGVRRSEREEPEQSRELTIIDNRDRGRRFEAEKPKKDKMWTEITKDLVSEEAIKERGYEYEETEAFYYVMEYLRYEDVLFLVELTEDIKRDRRERIREIQAEREFAERPRRPLALPQAWDEERVVEREIIYDRGPPPPRRYR